MGRGIEMHEEEPALQVWVQDLMQWHGGCWRQGGQAAMVGVQVPDVSILGSAVHWKRGGKTRFILEVELTDFWFSIG